MKQDEPAADWLNRRTLIALTALVVFVPAVIVLEFAQDLLRARWTYCFADKAPVLAQAQLDLARDAYARGEMSAALTVAEKGQEALEDAAFVRWPRRSLPYVDPTPPPGMAARPAIAVLASSIRVYRTWCYPVPSLREMGQKQS